MEYRHTEIEKKWQEKWKAEGTYKVNNDSSLPKYFVLDMFPYPSGAGLHVGHPLGYIASDIYARYKRQSGFNVLHPMGYDAFGLPAEQYAIQSGVHPAVSTAKNIEGFRRQMDNIGFSFDWSREINTSDPSYYKWTQWIFLQLFDHYYDKNVNKALHIIQLIDHFTNSGTTGVHAACSKQHEFSASEWNSYSNSQKQEILMDYRLAYRKTGFVNWCEALGTVLANDEVKDGVSERGGYPVVQKAMKQWSLRTTAYAERLLDDLESVDWSESLKIMQRNWIGKSEGAKVVFKLQDSTESVEVFTTRPDTLFGVTFMVLAPEHDLVKRISTEDQLPKIEEYIKYTEGRSERDRQSEVKKVSGAFTGAYALHPITQEKLPIWISEYVLKDYGTGAIMAVPAGDLRDNAFAKHFDLNITEIIDRNNYPQSSIEDKVGVMINSDFLNGMSVQGAIAYMVNYIEEKNIGERRINYKLRDANFSRQRYWGEPFPIVYDESEIAIRLSDDELPLELPDLEDFKPNTDGQAPLSKLTEWKQYKTSFQREVDTMPGFAGSSWYFLRYMDPHNDNQFASEDALNYWKDVDLYVGGAEHAVGHLLYARTWHKFLFDIGKVPTAEPFKKLINQGMIQGVSEKLIQIKGKQDSVRWINSDGEQKEIVFPVPSFVLISHEIKDQFDPEILTEQYVMVDLVKDYGLPDKGFLDTDGIKDYITRRPEFSNALFLGTDNYWYDGKFYSNAIEGKIYTRSEVEKMSKSKYNVINPDHVIAEYGADCFRLYEMFLGPVEQSKPWDMNGIDGVSKFLRKFWSLFFDDKGNFLVNNNQPSKDAHRILHTAIKKIKEDIEKFSFNTCVSAFMICVNDLRKEQVHEKEILEPLVRLLAPFAPHITEELWEQLGNQGSVTKAAFPEFNEAYLVLDEISYPLCINGKKKTIIDIPSQMESNEIEKLALMHPQLESWLDGKSIKKVIIVQGRMINIVV
jgi:leucyl-tRNA synthetase